VAGECIGIARNALARAAQYAKERVVFDRPIGQNQGVQHPLAQAWARVESANLMVMHAAALYDAGEPCGIEANAAKLLAADATVEATEAAQITFGGFGYAKEYHVERLVREALLFRIVDAFVVHSGKGAWTSKALLTESHVLGQRTFSP